MMPDRVADIRLRYGVNLFGFALLVMLGLVVDAGLARYAVAAVPIVVIAVGVSAIAPGAGVAGVLAAAPTMYELHPVPWRQASLVELAILALTAGIGLRLCWSLVHRDFAPWRALVTPVQVVLPVVLIVLAAIVAAIMVADPSRRAVSLREVRTVIIEPIMFLAAARIAFRNPVHRTFAAASFVGIGAAVAILAVLQVVLDSGGVRAGDILRATGPYPHPNNLSFFLERTFLLSVGFAIARPRWWGIWVLVAVQLAGLGLTWSRGAWLAAAFGVGVLFLIRGMYRWLAGLGLAGILAIVAAFIIAPDRIVDAGGSGVEPTRFTIWRASMRMVRDHPVFGVGPDQFLYQYWRRYVEPRGWPERYTSHPHNLILDIWLRLGVLGLVAFGTLLSGVIWRLRTTWKSIRADLWAPGAIAALAAGLLHGFVDNGFFLPDLATMTWFFLAILLSAPALSIPESNPQ
ncbi:MAG TPA: O-antigen ligase family protein [Thermomicrobiales bacterium]|nr:O-antigen ligase family protein [Thermomicrobiales bacterium]